METQSLLGISALFVLFNSLDKAVLVLMWVSVGAGTKDSSWPYFDSDRNERRRQIFLQRLHRDKPDLFQ